MFEKHRKETLQGCREDLRQIIGTFDSLPTGEGFSEFRVRDRIITSATRWSYFDFRSTMAYTVVGSPAFLLLLLGGWIYLIVLLPLGLGVLAGISYTVSALLAMLLLVGISKWIWRLTFWSTFIRFMAIKALVEVSVFVYSMQKCAIHPKSVWLLLGVVSGGFVAISLWFLIMFAASSVTSYVTRESLGVRRYDTALKKWIEATSMVHHSRDRIRRADVLKECLVLIESTARRIEAIGYPAKVSGLLASHQKVLLRDEARRMAEVFRNHKSALAKASRPEDVDAILKSMLAGVKALAIGDSGALLENAPERISRSDRLQRFAVWILPPAMLISAGLLLPMIPAVASQGAAVGSLRWTLIVAGVLSIVAAQKDVAARINDTLGKALSWK